KAAQAWGERGPHPRRLLRFVRRCIIQCWLLLHHAPMLPRDGTSEDSGTLRIALPVAAEKQTVATDCVLLYSTLSTPVTLQSTNSGSLPKPNRRRRSP